MRKPHCPRCQCSLLSLPGSVPVPLKLSEIYRRYLQRTVVQKATYLLDRLTGLPPQLGYRMAEDVDARWTKTRRFEVPA